MFNITLQNPTAEEIAAIAVEHEECAIHAELAAAFPEPEITAEQSEREYDAWLENRISKLEQQLTKLQLEIEALETF